MSQPDYNKAIWWPADASNWGYHDGAGCEITNWPRAWVVHTPEEDADDYAATPAYFQKPGIIASTTYFVSWLAFVFQCVEERFGAYGNALIGMPRPAIFLPNLNLNLQTLSIEVEGRRANIMQTMSPGQWTALVDLIRARSSFFNIPLDRDHILGHYQVSNQRSDPGEEFMTELVRRVQKKEDDMLRIFYQMIGRPEVYEETSEGLVHIISTGFLADLGVTWNSSENRWNGVKLLPVSDPIWSQRTVFPAGIPEILR